MVSDLVCRVCEGATNLEMLFKKENANTLAMLQSTVKLSIEPTDGLPKCICVDCTTKLEAAYNFLVQCESTDMKWRKQLQDLKPGNCEIDSSKHYIQNIDKVEEGFRYPEQDLSCDSTIVKQEYMPTSYLTDGTRVTSLPPYVVEGNGYAEPFLAPANNAEIKECINKAQIYQTDGEDYDVHSKICVSKIEIEDFSSEAYDADVTSENDAENYVSTNSEEQPNEELGGSTKILTCEQCGKRFSRMQRLRQHQILHADPKFFSCEQCGKTFAESQRLRLHRRLHTNPNLFKCEVCGKVLSDQRCYMRHQKVHTGQFEFASCYACHRVFTTRSNLKRHMERKHKHAMQTTSKDKVSSDGVDELDEDSVQ